MEAEQDPKKANPLEYAIKGYKYITDTLKKSNLERCTLKSIASSILKKLIPTLIPIDLENSNNLM